MTEKLIYMVFNDSDDNCETTKYETLKDANYWAEITWTRMTDKEKAERNVWVGALTEEDFNKAENAVDDIDVIPTYWDYAFVDNTMFDSNIYKVYEELLDSAYCNVTNFETGKDEDHFNYEWTLKDGRRYQVENIPFLVYGLESTREKAKEYYHDYFIDEGDFVEDGDYLKDVAEYVVMHNLLFPEHTYLD